MKTVQDFKTEFTNISDRSTFCRRFPLTGFLIGPPEYNGTSTWLHRLTHSLTSQLYLVEAGFEVTVGRGSDQQISLPDIGVFSRKHATLRLNHQSLEVMNLSRNGTYLGGAPFVREADEDGYVKLHMGDTRAIPPNSLIRFGPSLATMVADSELTTGTPDLNMPWMYLGATGMWQFIVRNSDS